MGSFMNFHVTVQGASHAKKGVVCQDYSKSVSFENACAAAVADGHGDIRYFRSDIGSRLAVEAAVKSMKEFVSRECNVMPEQDVNEKLDRLKKNIILNWNNKVNRHARANPFTEEELAPLSENRRNFIENGKYIETAYGTTLIAAAVTSQYWFAIQIGDGDCGAFRTNGTLETVPKESGLVGNITTSLCEPDAIYKFHHIYRAEPSASIVMSTDGVKNSFTSCENYENFIRKIVLAFSSEPYAPTKTNLRDFMREMTAKGSGDDLSIAGIIQSEN